MMLALLTRPRCGKKMQEASFIKFLYDPKVKVQTNITAGDIMLVSRQKALPKQSMMGLDCRR